MIKKSKGCKIWIDAGQLFLHKLLKDSGKSDIYVWFTQIGVLIKQSCQANSSIPNVQTTVILELHKVRKAVKIYFILLYGFKQDCFY